MNTLSPVYQRYLYFPPHTIALIYQSRDHVQTEEDKELKVLYIDLWQSCQSGISLHRINLYKQIDSW